MTRHDNLRTACRRAARIVATWPEWKREFLFYSMKATNPEPRPEVKTKGKP